MDNSTSLSGTEILMFAEADVPAELRKQVWVLHREAWPDHDPHGHDPVLRPLSMLLLKDGRVLSTLDVLTKNIQHRGRVYVASGLSAVVTDFRHRGCGFGRLLVRTAREEIGRRGTDLGLFTCDPSLQRFYEEAGWRTLTGTVLVGGTPDRPVLSEREGKITMGHFYSTRARERADAFIGTRIKLYPGEIDKLW